MEEGFKHWVNVKLTDPTIQGTVNAGTGLTMPAFTMAGDISLGANKLKTTNLFLKEINVDSFALRDVGDTTYKDLMLHHLYSNGYIVFNTSTGNIRAANSDNSYVIGKARDTGVGLVEIFRMAGATVAHLLLTRARFTTSAHAADADHRGFLYFEEGGAGVADKLYCIMKAADDTYSAVQVAIG